MWLLLLTGRGVAQVLAAERSIFIGAWPLLLLVMVVHRGPVALGCQHVRPWLSTAAIVMSVGGGTRWLDKDRFGGATLRTPLVVIIPPVQLFLVRECLLLLLLAARGAVFTPTASILGIETLKLNGPLFSACL